MPPRLRIARFGGGTDAPGAWKSNSRQVIGSYESLTFQGAFAGMPFTKQEAIERFCLMTFLTCADGTSARGLSSRNALGRSDSGRRTKRLPTDERPTHNGFTCSLACQTKKRDLLSFEYRIVSDALRPGGHPSSSSGWTWGATPDLTRKAPILSTVSHLPRKPPDFGQGGESAMAEPFFFFFFFF